MFVLKNAWAALGRVKWRTALTALLALLVSFSAAVDLAVLRADDKANNETYQSQKASAVIRPSAKVTAKRDGADSNYTANYMTWDMYTKYAEAVQKNNLTFEYTLATSVPVRASKSLQAIAAKSDTSEDKTGGNLTLQAFYTNDAAKINDYGTFKVVKGKQLNYKTANDGVLVSQAVAKKNNLKVGDKVTVGNPTKASETYKFTVRGIYEYTGEAPAGYGSDAKYAKDNRENVVYTSYINFAQSGLDVAGTKGWAIPNLNIIFTLTDPATYNKFVRLVTKAKLDTSKFTISSPSLDAYKKRIAPLDAAAKAARTALLATLIVGGLALLALVLWAAIGGRRDEIGMAMVSGVTKGRLGWQFMLETFMMTVPGWAIGLIAGALLDKPLGTAWAGGQAVAITSASVWNMIWYGLGACLVLGIAGGNSRVDGTYGGERMSEKDVKDNETEALNNAAAENAENADIEAGETDMATSIESVDFAVVYDDGGDSIATESAENAENTEGIATEDSVASDNANRVNETLALGATDDEQSLDQHETVQADSATSVSSQIDREIKHHRKKDAFFFKANPTFALDHVTVHNRKTGRDVLDDVSLAFHAGATHAVLVDAEDVEQHQALVATMVGMMRTTSGNVMHKSTNLADATPVDVLGHRIGFIPQRFAVRGDLDAEGNVLYAMDASNRNFLQPKPVIARELLKRVGFEEVTSGLPVGKMSALDQRRVAIARALSCEAEVIIADEPTAGLNRDDAAVVLGLLKKAKRDEDRKRAIIVVTDNPEVADQMEHCAELE